ncbi:MAG TPA: hypothetical protein VD794_13800 [Flavisolibacter sp.]|nr:hypothetical protein [Flavisolibacter sp.]
MRIPIFLLAALIIFSCTNKDANQSTPTSYWAGLKDSFPTRNLATFAVDSQLQRTYKTFPVIRNRVIDSVISYGTPYLYSWQDYPSSFTTFTTYVNDGEHGSRILYFIFDNKDSLYAALQLANKGGEAGMIYETQSRFIAKDTLLKVSAASTKLDLTKPTPWPALSRSKGDSTFYHVVFLKDGSVAQIQVAVKKELDLK